MLRFVGRYALHALVVLGIVTFVTTLLLDLTPGDPALQILGEGATPEQLENLRQQLNLDQPVVVRYLSWLTGAVQGDLGTSPINHQPVLAQILSRIPVTLELAVVALTMSLIIAVPIGILTAARAGKAVDEGWSLISSILISMPYFVTALVLVLVFGVGLGVFPTLGWAPLSAGLAENLRYVFLPALTLSLLEIPVFSRLLRADMVATLDRDFILSARARGMSSAYVLFRHALRPSSFSLLTLAGLSLGRLIGGAIIVEYIFSLPGLGQLMLNAINTKDLVTVQGVVLFITVSYVVINAMVDILYGYIDPRVRARV